MSSIINSFFRNSPAPKQVDGEPTNGTPDRRGTKRKAKADPYEDMDEENTPQRTPTSARAKSRNSTDAPHSSAKGRPSAGTMKRRSRSIGTRKSDAAEESRIDATANLERAHAPEAARLQPEQEEEKEGTLVPVANMGDSEILGNNDISAVPNETVKAKPKAINKSTPKGKGKAAQTTKAAAEEDEDDDREEHEIGSLLKHRMAPDGSGAVEILVHWAGEKEEDATWELEEEIQRGAEETLYAYWKKQGGRINALFIKPKNPPAETYHVFKVLGHGKKARGGFQFEVQWVGHPATRGETSMEAEAKLKKVAPELLEEYWESIGGRASHLAKRGRAKRPRTE